MKPNRNFPPIRFFATVVLPAGFLLLGLVFFASCQKEAEDLLPERSENSVTAQTLKPRSLAAEQAVLAYVQWVLDNLVPLAENQAALADIEAGNYYTNAVRAYVQGRGFVHFDAFAQAHATLLAPIKAGNLSADLIAGILGENLGTLNFATSIGSMVSDAQLPCYEQFVTDLGYALLAAAAASETVVGGVVAGAVGVLNAYHNFKNCIRATYPNGG